MKIRNPHWNGRPASLDWNIGEPRIIFFEYRFHEVVVDFPAIIERNHMLNNIFGKEWRQNAQQPRTERGPSADMPRLPIRPQTIQLDGIRRVRLALTHRRKLFKQGRFDLTREILRQNRARDRVHETPQLPVVMHYRR